MLATEEGVYYRKSDYAGFVRRMLIDIIDAIVVSILWIGMSVVEMSGAIDFIDDYINSTQPFYWAIAYAYWVVLKWSPLRTLGYRLLGVRIVNLQGDAPGLKWLTLRFLFVLFGPINFLLDMLFISSSEQGRALRDMFAQTYVVRSNAVPAGRGPIRRVYFMGFGANVLCQEIAPTYQPLLASS